MNEQFFEAFSDMLPEGYGEDPSRVIQPVDQAPPSSGRVQEEAYSGNSGNSAESVDNPGPTQTPLEAPTAHRYQDNPKDAAVIERQLFLQNYAGLAGLALDNTSDPGYRDVSSDKDGYTYRWYANNTYQVLSGPKNVGKTYTDTKGVLTATFGPYSSQPTGSSSSSTKKKSMSKKGATALGAGIGAGVGELAKSLASMLGPQSATPLTTEELTGTTTTETSSGVPWGWILGGAGVLLVGGVVIFAVSRGGSSSEE